MKPLPKIVIVLTICGMAFVFAFAFRVLLPYYRQQQDRPRQLESQEEVGVIMNAINRYVEESPERSFPPSLAEVKPLIATTATNLDAVLNKFVYIQPPPHTSKRALFGRVVLIEKLGHYKNREGGYYGIAGDSIPRWYSPSDYKMLAEKNGLSIEQFWEHHGNGVSQ
jgi:hypothetical protein